MNLNIRDLIARILGYIPPEVHNSELRKLERSLKSLVDIREQQVVNLQNELISCKQSNQEQDKLIEKIEGLTAKLQQLKKQNEETLRKADEQAKTVSECIASVLISYIPYMNLLNINEDLSLREGLLLLKAKYEDILMLCGVTTVKAYDGIFNASIQKVVGNNITDDVSLENHVVEVVNPGYFIGDKCIQPMEVIIYSNK